MELKPAGNKSTYCLNTAFNRTLLEKSEYAVTVV